MRTGAVQIPYEALDRTVEYLDGAPRLGSIKFKAHAVISFWNLLSHLHHAHYFDSVREFLEYQNNLRPYFDRIAFREVKVVGRDDTLELRISDDTGEAKLIYPYTPIIVEGHETLPDGMNNPVHGAREGDKLQIFDSIYRGRSAIIIPTTWYLKNDDHYRRMREIRESAIKRFHEMR